MMYIHATACISPQQSFDGSLQEILLQPKRSDTSQFPAIEPSYGDYLPMNLIRRMGKASRMSVSAAMALIKKYPQYPVNSIILGTGFGGLEDNLLFLKQIIEYQEGRLTPTHFVSSMPSALLAPIILMTQLRGYNVVHTQKGHAFEQSLIDADIRLQEYPDENILLGACDELTDSNYNPMKSLGLLNSSPLDQVPINNFDHQGVVMGEAAMYFLVNNQKENSLASVRHLQQFFIENQENLSRKISEIKAKTSHLPDLILAGYNYDGNQNRLIHAALEQLSPNTPVAAFKNLCGEFPCASAFGLWMATQLLHEKSNLNLKILNNKSVTDNTKSIWIFNAYRGRYWGLMEVSI